MTFTVLSIRSRMVSGLGFKCICSMTKLSFLTLMFQTKVSCCSVAQNMRVYFL